LETEVVRESESNTWTWSEILPPLQRSSHSSERSRQESNEAGLAFLPVCEAGGSEGDVNQAADMAMRLKPQSSL